MEFGCSVCEYTSSKKSHVVRHINRRKTCGPGIKEIIEIPIDIICEYCSKNFATKANLSEHIKNNCTHKEDVLKDRIKKLEEENKKLRETAKTTINNNDNRVINNIVVVVNYEDTKFDKISDKAYSKIIKEAETHQIIPNLIKAVHFNPDIPENHNVYLSNRNKNNKHLQIFNNGHWEVINKDSEIDNIINDKETNISDWVIEKGEKYPEAVEKFNEYLEQKYDEEVSKLIKEQVELVLYNNRHLIKT